jgi:serine/threonine-protein kinase RsbW
MEREIAETKNEEVGGLDPVSLTLPSSAEYVMLARLVAGQVGRLAGFEPEDVYDLKLAVTEAVTNVIRHAAVDAYEVEYRVIGQTVEVTVTDTGGGFQRSDLAGEPDEQGGFGLTVIENLVDELVLDSKGDGTRMKMVRRASGPGGRKG